MSKLKNTLIAFGFCAYNLLFSTGNILAQQKEAQTPIEYPSTQNLATDYRPAFKTEFLPCLYPPKTEEQKLERTLIEKDAIEKMKFGSLENSSFISTYSILKIKFNIPFLE